MGASRVIVVGIAGGIASGKSAVADAFAQFGARIIDGDRIGHQVLLDPAVIAAAVQRWGNEVLDENGSLRRRAIAARVFGDSAASAEELAFWEGVVHPKIGQEMQTQIDQFRAGGQVSVVILDAAVMFKSGWHRHCDHLVFVDVPETLRRERARSRGWSDAEFALRERIQTPIEIKRQLSDFVIDNSGSFDQTYEQVRTLWSLLSSGNPPST
jgi:dephospho-CoA kinase